MGGGGCVVGIIRIKAISVQSIEIEFGLTGTELDKNCQHNSYKRNGEIIWLENIWSCRVNMGGGAAYLFSLVKLDA